jgi:hypothetical protein
VYRGREHCAKGRAHCAKGKGTFCLGEGNIVNRGREHYV